MSESPSSPPRIDPLRHTLGKLILRLNGWRVEGDWPKVPKMVIIFAPHTSNWDFVYAMSAILSRGYKPNYLGKKSLFWGPLGWFMRWMGGIPVNRGRSYNMVEQTVRAIQASETMMLGIAPEGTRSHSGYWRSGFYHIAHQANVPIVFFSLDYRKKLARFGEGILPSGDIQADMEKIRPFFEGVQGKFPNQMGEIRFRPYETGAGAR